jgi:hypothetical protein
MIAADGTAIYPWNHGETLTASALNAAIAQSTGAASGTTPPANPASGDLWFNPSTGQMSVWNGTAWQALSYLPLTGGTMTGKLTIASGGLNVQNLPTSATGLSSGDIYINGGFLCIMP